MKTTRLTSEQRRSIEAWMVTRQKTFGLFRTPVTAAWWQYVGGGGLKITLRQFYSILLYARCTGVVKKWRGQRKGPPAEQLLLFPEMEEVQ